MFILFMLNSIIFTLRGILLSCEIKVVIMGSKKREFCLEDLTILKSRKKGPIKYLPEDFFREHDKVARALLQSLEDNDAGAFLEILDAYLKVNRTKIARESCLS